jgi:Fic-DOC domain mobile mystery protein B
MEELHDEPDGATQLEPDERDGLRLKHITTRSELNEVEQANISIAIEWLDRSRNHDILSEQWLRNLHTKMFGEVWSWSGRFRTSEKNISVSPYEIGPKLRELLDDTKYWIQNNTYTPLEIAARFHHRLVQIHLFPNGNGRHARIAADELLSRVLNHSPINWDGDGDLNKENERRNSYISALRNADSSDYEALLKFVAPKD